MKYLLTVFLLVMMFFSNAFSILATARDNVEAKNFVDFDHSMDNLKIDAHISKVKQVNRKWNGLVEVNLRILSQTDKQIDMTYELEKVSQDRYQVNQLDKKTVFRGKLQKNQNRRIDIPLQGLTNGEYRVRLQASSKQNKDVTWGDLKDILFTISDKGIDFKWHHGVKSWAPATNEKGQRSVIADPNSMTGDLLKGKKPRIASKNMHTLGTVTLSGTWKNVNRSNVSQPIQGAQVDLFYHTSSGWFLAGTAFTNSNGNWSITYQSPTNSDLWQLNVATMTRNGSIKIVNQQYYPHFTYIQNRNWAYGGNIGTWIVASSIKKPFWLLDDAQKVRNLMTSVADPGYTTVVWYPGSTEGAYYMPGKFVHLSDESANYPSIPMHEVAHNYMYNAYGRFPNAPNCSPHYIERSSSQGCAWTEGWADFVALVANGSPYFYFSNGSSTNLEYTNWFDRGDTVQGRIAGALWDMYDAQQDTQSNITDDQQFSFSTMLTVMRQSSANTFWDYWYYWNKYNYWQSAKKCLQMNSIYY